ncbi:TOBE domain-containing protein [Dactylosporangium sp. NPDC049140]
MITRNAAEDLGLAAGARVVVLVKSTEVSVALP